MHHILDKRKTAVPPDPDTAILVKNLTKVYRLYDRPQDRFLEAVSVKKRSLHRERSALKDVSFDVKKGECVGVIGTNGSGKSTLLKILTGVLSPTSGEIAVSGRISALLELGAGFNLEYTGVENVFLNGRMMKFTREEIERRLPEILAFADIGEYAYQPVRTYSSGMFARLAFAVAINVDAEILIVDEALSVGDIFFQNKCFRKFEELKEKGTTILFVSHDLESVRKMTSRTLWIEQGTQMLFGDTIEVASAYARQLLLMNNTMATAPEEADTSDDPYEKRRFALDRWPGVLPNSENLLNDDVIVRACFFAGEDGKAEYDLICGRRYRLVVIFESHIDLAECIVGYILQNRKGVSLINSNTLITGRQRPFRVKAGTMNRVEFDLTLPGLYSDEYVIDCAVANGRSVLDNEMKTWCFGALKVMVHNEDVCLALFNVHSDVTVYEMDLRDLHA